MEKVIALLEENKVLLKENNALLKEILGKIKEYESEEHKDKEDMRGFLINITANLFVELLEENQDLRTKIMQSFQMKG